ncbi:hypothetical protein HID58_059161 [Brassica napus]|uniref:BnaC04g53980D protein n=3 Tax=Brassica TaxID=3705 RepID=A0A078JHI3_BRANA|nr:hypothetical protein HID58_059161 [Brassica napus]CAF1818697.1 unnamed protein product [Brassica napus]CDY65965.1 BnaC04g53980D [Brassica napus]
MSMMMSSGSNEIRDGGSDDCSFFDDDIVKLILQRENHKNPNCFRPRKSLGRHWLQVEKSQILALKHASIQSIERQCLMLDQKIATEIVMMISINVSIAEFYGTLKNEVEELKELDQERDKYYKLKCSEMNEFMQNVERFRSENRLQVKNLRDQVKESSSTFEELHNKNNYLRNTN